MEGEEEQEVAAEAAASPEVAVETETSPEVAVNPELCPVCLEGGHERKAFEVVVRGGTPLRRCRTGHLW